MILPLVAAAVFVGGSVAPATARLFQAADDCMDEDQCQYMDQGPCACPAEQCEVSCDPCRCGPRWTFAAEALGLQRTGTRSQPLFLENPQFMNTGSLDAQDLNFGVAVGPRLSAIRHGDCCWDVEVVYFWLDGFAAEANVPGTSRMVTNSADGAYFTVTDGAARYTSALYSGELNLRRQWTEWLTLVAGFRMGQLNECYRGVGTDVTTLQIDSLSTNTSNHFYGFQLGCDLVVYDMGGPLTINAVCRGGVFGNAARQSYQRIQGGVSSDSFSASRDQGAFLGETGLVATYALTERLAFRASAEAMWLTGVALAPEQVGSVDLRTETASINTSGAVFYYGGGLGLEYRF
jgi:hypothetical protein